MKEWVELFYFLAAFSATMLGATAGMRFGYYLIVEFYALYRRRKMRMERLDGQYKSEE